ncbi:MAG: hypothetical protein BWY94_02484 [Actinobacteria bacterium ADurb.BinA094]|nr:MAG: hypothetical protein BWY94_02484 [Actinobacteria bacterium ADurb.BinA094]
MPHLAQRGGGGHGIRLHQVGRGGGTGGEDDPVDDVLGAVGEPHSGPLALGVEGVDAGMPPQVGAARGEGVDESVG